MKKSLFAVAAVTAFAGAAQAQSSVTVYGILDVGYIGSNTTYNANDGAAYGASSSKGVTKSTTSQFGASAESSSRLGFKGTEDLGGGMQALFTVEMGLNPATSQLSGSSAMAKEAGGLVQTTNTTGSAVDNRQSFVGLHKNGIGQFSFGRQYTTVFQEASATSPNQQNNVNGDVIYTPSSNAGNNNTGMAGNSAYTTRADNALIVNTDSFGGFKAGGMYAMANGNTTLINNGTSAPSAGGVANWSGWGLNADFTWQKLYATVAYQSFKTQYTAAQYSTNLVVNLAGAGAVSGQIIPSTTLFNATNLSDKQTYVAGTYDFGILKAYLQWIGRKVQQDTAAAGFAGAQVNRNAQQIGVRSFITPTIEAWGSIGNGKYTGPIVVANTQPGSVNFIGFQLGANYLLSKRTNLYAIYGQTQTSASTSGAVGAGSSANQYAVGVRHTF